MKRTAKKKNLPSCTHRIWVSILVILTLLGATSVGFAQTSQWHNITGAICYIHLEWPNGEITDFALQPHETRALSIQSDPPPKYCWSHRGPIKDCQQACRRGDAKGIWSVSTTAINGCEPGVISAC